jgi:hypothetical protein
MEKLLNDLRTNLKISFINIQNSESEKTLYKYQDSLFLSITESGLNWQKKKIESLFESGSLNENELDENDFEICKQQGLISECLKPSKKGFYFINLNGLYFIESKRISNLKVSLINQLQHNFYQEINWNLKDEEKLIISLLIIFNAFNDNSSFKLTKENEKEIWLFVKTKLASGLEEIGICKSFETKIEDKSTKYVSAQNFISGHPSILSRTGFFIPNNGKYHLDLKDDSENLFLVDLLFKDLGYAVKLKYVELIEQLGRELFMQSILKDKFYFNEDLRKTMLQ